MKSSAFSLITTTLATLTWCFAPATHAGGIPESAKASTDLVAYFTVSGDKAALQEFAKALSPRIAKICQLGETAYGDASRGPAASTDQKTDKFMCASGDAKPGNVYTCSVRDARKVKAFAGFATAIAKVTQKLGDLKGGQDAPPPLTLIMQVATTTADSICGYKWCIPYGGIRKIRNRTVCDAC